MQAAHEWVDAVRAKIDPAEPLYHLVELPRPGLARLEPGPAPGPYLGNAAAGAENRRRQGARRCAGLGKGVRPRARCWWNWTSDCPTTAPAPCGDPASFPHPAGRPPQRRLPHEDPVWHATQEHSRSPRRSSSRLSALQRPRRRRAPEWTAQQPLKSAGPAGTWRVSPRSSPTRKP